MYSPIPTAAKSVILRTEPSLRPGTIDMGRSSSLPSSSSLMAARSRSTPAGSELRAKRDRP